MESFTQVTGKVIPLDRANVDTDALMPKQYLKCIKKSGYGDWLFDDWRYLDVGDVETPTSSRRLNPDFELNLPQYAGGSILLAQKNFGCGSSREHAVWGLRDFGIRVVIAPDFADIFRSNCFNNGLLPITLLQVEIDQLFLLAQGRTGVDVTVDLEAQKLYLPRTGSLAFSVDSGRREKLLRGLDNIAVTLGKNSVIGAFEARYRLAYPWLFNNL